MSVSVIICAYTERRWLDLVEAIHSVSIQTHSPLEIILVIDHNEQLLQKARQTFYQATVIENKLGRGLSGARNSGLMVARGDIVAFMDEDAVANVNWLEKLSAHYDNRDVIGVGGKIVPNWEGKRPFWFPSEFDWVVGCTYLGMPETATPVRNLIGCNMSFRCHLFDTVGGFREGMGRIGTLPVGCEETEFCIRAHQKWPNKTILYEPAAQVFHQVPRIRANWKYFRSRCYSEGISKAMVTELVGAQDGLSNERRYMTQTLPLGVLKGVLDLVSGRDIRGIQRALAIVMGLGFTVLGYGVGKVQNVRSALPTLSTLQSKEV